VETAVDDNHALHRYEITTDGEVAGFTVYELQPDVIAFMHTEIGEEWGGRGLGSTLVRGALDDARSRGLAVLPYCPFVRSWLERHDDYVDLVPEAKRRAFGLGTDAGG
jgi:predicted GNAT family acetyltransferase